MKRKRPIGLFITGTDTNVGKTHVAAMIARDLTGRGMKVGVYKPAASGALTKSDGLVSEDAIKLWEAAGSFGDFSKVCPQVFAAPLAPHLAARAEGRRLDPQLLRTGLEYWLEASDIVLVEGAGGLMSPIGDEEYVADLADEFGLPLVVVARNQVGAINQVLQTLIVAATFREGLPVAGVLLNTIDAVSDDPSRESNKDEIERHACSPVLAEVEYAAVEFSAPVDWLALAQARSPRSAAWTDESTAFGEVGQGEVGLHDE
jgi:dethiobiotin synthetase